MAAGELSCLARNGGAAGRGRKLTGAIAAKAIEAQPVFGQIKPLKRPFGAVDNSDRDKETMATLCASSRPAPSAADHVDQQTPSVWNDIDTVSGSFESSHRHAGRATGDAVPMT